VATICKLRGSSIFHQEKKIKLKSNADYHRGTSQPNTFSVQMAMTLSTSELSTRISSLWKGYRTRKIFADLEAVTSWDEYKSLDDAYHKKVEENPSLSYLPALNAALTKTYNRLWDEDEEPPCTCSWCVNYPDDQQDDDGETGLDWNESGYFD
jgi:hypothetical protein